MRLVFTAFLFVLFGAFACDGDGQGKYHDPVGFSLKLEPGWTASFQKGAYIEIVSADNKSRGVVFPFMAKAATSAESCLADAPKMFAETFPEAKLTTSKQTKQKPDEAVANYSAQAGSGLGLCSADGLSCMLYLAFTPGGAESDDMKKIIRMWESLSFDEPGKNSEQIAGTDWIEPKENAFRIRVPDGYTAEGGLFRLGSVDTRIHIRLKSSDAAINVGIGDKDLPKFSSQLNAAEGSIYNPGFGNTMTVKRFRSGGQFATEYATHNAAALGCPGAQAVGKELEDMSAQLQKLEDQAGNLFKKRVSAGEASVTCTKDGSEHYGYIFAKTTLTQDGMGIDTGTWEAEVSGFTSPKARESEARNVAVAVYRSFKLEEAWAKAQGQTAVNTSQIVAKTGDQIATMMSKQFANTQVSMDRIFRNWSNATLGQTDVADLTTGEVYKIASGKNYYWRKAGTNVVAGTDQYERPDIDFSPLLELK